MSRTFESLKNVTTRNLIVTGWKEPLELAYRDMKESRLRHLPVVDDAGFIIGIISDRDFQRAMQTDSMSFDADDEVRDYMSWPVRAIDESATVADAARVIIDEKISALLVIRPNGDVVGIVTTEDLLRAFIAPHESTIESLKNEAQVAVYKSRVGEFAHALANVGI